jgi:hypothetical protein
MLDASLLLPERPRPLKRTEYDRLVALGAFEDERIELLHGVLVDMSPKDPGHVSPIDRLNMVLTPPSWARSPFAFSRPSSRTTSPSPTSPLFLSATTAKEHPARALLVIEGAVSSLNKDRNVKAPLMPPPASGSTGS